MSMDSHKSQRSSDSLENAHQGGISFTKADNFKVMIDVHHFSPDEISIKKIDDKLVVEGKHQEKVDEHGYISREFVRRYQLPKGIEVDHVTSYLSSDGVLTIIVPKAVPEKDDNALHFPIIHTGTPAVHAYPGKYGPHVLHGTLACHAAHHASHEHQDSPYHQYPRKQCFIEPHPPAVHAYLGKYGPHVLHGTWACHAAHHASHEHQDAHWHQDPRTQCFSEPQLHVKPWL